MTKTELKQLKRELKDRNNAKKLRTIFYGKYEPKPIYSWSELEPIQQKQWIRLARYLRKKL